MKHEFTADERGVSEVLGAVLVFGLVLAVLVIVQVSGVPNANAQIEFQHNERVHGDFQELGEDVLVAGGTDRQSETSVELGLRYPVRLFLLNPAPVSGAVYTEEADVSLLNVKALDTDPETADYWDGSPRDFEFNQRIRYTVGYDQYSQAPETVYEAGVAYNRFADGTVLPLRIAGSSLVAGNRITLYTLDGELSNAGTGARTLTLVPRSASAGSLAVEGDGTGIQLRLDSELTRQQWERLLESELDGNYDPATGTTASPDPNDGRYVVGIDDSGPVVISFEQGAVYELDLAKVRVGTGGTTDLEEPTYITTVSGDGTSVTEGTSQRLVAQVRDGFNNPVAGVPVEFETAQGVFSDGSSSVTVETDAEGLAAVTFTSFNTEGNTVEATFGGGESAERSATFNVNVIDTSSDDSGDINPGRLKLISSGIVGQKSNVVLMTFENTGGLVSISEMRLNYYFAGASGAPNSGKRVIDAAEITKIMVDGTDEVGSIQSNPVMLEKGPYVSLNDLLVEGGETLEIELTFDISVKNAGNGNAGPPKEVNELDFYFTTMGFTDGETAVYLASPTS